MVRVKICGQTREEDVKASVAAGADAVGVIVDVPVDTPREVDRARATELLEVVPPFVTGVLVTMQEHAADVRDLIEDVHPDAVQVHGGLALGEMEDLVRTTTIPVLAATDVESRDEIDELADVVDALLLDSRDENGGGGTGRTHDWAAARDISRSVDVPVALAGGLTPENVETAIETVDPFAVDVATGVESNGGRKDHRALETFMNRATTKSRRVTR